jgi:kynurenine formamidase
MFFDSMDEFPHPSLLPMLKKLQENWVENLQYLNKIIEKCTDNLPGHNEMPGKVLSRFTFYSDLFRGHIIDLTAPLNKKTICFPGDPQFKRSCFRKYKDAGVNLSFVETGLHVGTHVDAPLHFLDKGQSIDSMPAGVFSGEAWVIKALKKPFQDITPEDVEKNEINPGEIIFFYTGWSKRVNTPRFFEEGWPGITPEAMDLLIAKGVKAIGIDSGSVDSAAGLAAGCFAHKKAAEAGIPIFETLVNLDKFNGRFYFFGFPLRFEGAEASPVRAIGVTPYDL